MAKLNRREILKAVNENLDGFASVSYNSEWSEFRVREFGHTDIYYTNSLIDAIETAMNYRVHALAQIARKFSEIPLDC